MVKNSLDDKGSQLFDVENGGEAVVRISRTGFRYDITRKPFEDTNVHLSKNSLDDAFPIRSVRGCVRHDHIESSYETVYCLANQGAAISKYLDRSVTGRPLVLRYLDSVFGAKRYFVFNCVLDYKLKAQPAFTFESHTDSRDHAAVQVNHYPNDWATNNQVCPITTPEVDIGDGGINEIAKAWARRHALASELAMSCFELFWPRAHHCCASGVSA